MSGILVIISGPSGSGKGEVIKRLDYALSVSVTTRTRRIGEENGREYFFCNEEEFARMRDEDLLLEHAVYMGKYYGTPKLYVEEQIAKGNVALLEIDVNGALQVKEKFPEAILVFMLPPTIEELARRLVNRATESLSEIDERIHKSIEEICLVEKYDYLVINDVLEETVKDLNAIISAERQKPFRLQKKLNKFIGL